ncbi:HK97 gp10 family phage protein [Kitasatospora acidiphila]|uniref:HK97 gp10 family phage protein n=1 Tax=Kitasatospora acidiphila TaxID=2567942 RepID=A0A540W974_9ACTN|nr:HK97 gp10 family phage protein [Kitasatospora acidiphila]TQF05561.1 HK97 gp10 family phage protein [Kitasatospora acidiphila]
MASPVNPHPNAHPSAGAYSNGAQLAVQLEARAAALLPAAVAVVRHHAMLLETAIKAQASGRPGPNAVTGDYRRSWTHEVRTVSGGVEAVVGTNKPQARRLEFGFVGPDILDRVFHQPPYPHVAPAVAQIEPLFTAAMARLAEGSGQ